MQSTDLAPWWAKKSTKRPCGIQEAERSLIHPFSPPFLHFVGQPHGREKEQTPSPTAVKQIPPPSIKQDKSFLTPELEPWHSWDCTALSTDPSFSRIFCCSHAWGTTDAELLGAGAQSTAECGICRDYLKSGCSFMWDLRALPSLISKKGNLNSGTRAASSLSQDIQELESCKDVLQSRYLCMSVYTSLI